MHDIRCSACFDRKGSYSHHGPSTSLISRDVNDGKRNTPPANTSCCRLEHIPFCDDEDAAAPAKPRQAAPRERKGTRAEHIWSRREHVRSSPCAHYRDLAIGREDAARDAHRRHSSWGHPTLQTPTRPLHHQRRASVPRVCNAAPRSRARVDAALLWSAGTSLRLQRWRASCCLRLPQKRGTLSRRSLLFT